MKPVTLSEHGVALVLVLWVLSLLTIMVGSFSLSIQRETALVANIRDKVRAIAMAEAGITLAQLHLLLLDKEQRWRANGTIYPVNFNGEKIRIKIESESGKIDLNKADETLLTNMLQQTSLAIEKQIFIVNAILDWRDKDDLVRIDGAEKRNYQEAGLKYQPRNKPFQSIEELRLVLGVTTDLYEQLKPMVTIYSKQKRVNLKEANRQVLLAVSGLDPTQIDDFIARRVDSEIHHLPAPNLEGQARQAITIRSSKIYHVIAEAQLDNGTKARIQVIMKKNLGHNKPLFTRLDWKRYAFLDTSLFSETMDFLLITPDAELNP